MKVIRKKADPGGGTAAAAPAAGGTAKAPMILNRSKAPPKLTREEEAASKVANLLEKLALAPGADEASKALLDGRTSVAGVMEASGFAAAQASGFLQMLVDTATAASSTLEQREAALLALSQLPAAAGRACEPYLVPLLPALLEACADKGSPAVRSAALAAGKALMGELCPHAVGLVLPVLFESMADTKKWQTKEAALKLLSALAAAAPGPLSGLLPDIVPVISELMVDPREQVKVAAAEAGAATFALMGNRDIAALVSDLLGCVARPGEVADVVSKLSATTFVQAVEAPALAVMVPLLLRGLKDEQPTPIKRKACVIITNMSKLVSSPVDASKFLPRLLPGVERIERTAADPELRDVAAAALAVLGRVGAEAVQQEEEAERVTPEETLRLLRDAIAVAQGSTPPLPEAPLAYIAALATQLVDTKALDFDVWRDCTVPFLAAWMEESTAEAVGRAFMAKCGEKMGGVEDVDAGWEEEAEGADRQLCDCRFSLAYGGKILLNNAQLRLMRGRRYGLCGGNGVGKSTLMKAIAKGQLDGFPPATELRTVYVEHDIQASLADHTVLDYVAQDPMIKSMGRCAEEVAGALTDVGFAADMLQNPVTSCSGGWKMKLALARAMLLRADILLLDEPTNHLDTTNVAWLINYLVNQPDVTSMIVSHDSGFLDAVCTDIIHYQSRQLRRYKGNLSHFVEAVPAAKSYYELEAASLRFRFPTPGLLDGISTKEKPIVKLSGVSFTYPGASKPQLTNVNIMCRLSSRVAVLGANGAGKSTLIKMVTGETKADKGTVWRHPNLRMAYVAQHAFHHLEEHLDTTPLKYMYKRYGMGEDKEENSKVTRAVEEEDKKKMAAAVWNFDGHPRRFDKIISRRKKKKDFEYEVQWQGLPSIKFNRWIARAELIDQGFSKFVNEFDGKKAAAAIGSDARPLTKANVEKFLADFGLDPEFGTHSNIRGLSGGQKVKLVLAAAMWLAPHLLIMDEPTNYLDREALGALAAAIRDFDGGVVLISHNSEFTSAITNEVWQVADGKVVCHAKEAKQ